MRTVLKVKVCEVCDEEFIIYYEQGETDEKECPKCDDEVVKFVPDEDLTFDTIM